MIDTTAPPIVPLELVSGTTTPYLAPSSVTENHGPYGGRFLNVLDFVKQITPAPGEWEYERYVLRSHRGGLAGTSGRSTSSVHGAQVVAPDRPAPSRTAHTDSLARTVCALKPDCQRPRSHRDWLYDIDINAFGWQALPVKDDR